MNKNCSYLGTIACTFLRKGGSTVLRAADVRLEDLVQFLCCDSIQHLPCQVRSTQSLMMTKQPVSGICRLISYFFYFSFLVNNNNNNNCKHELSVLFSPCRLKPHLPSNILEAPGLRGEATSILSSTQVFMLLRFPYDSAEASVTDVLTNMNQQPNFCKFLQFRIPTCSRDCDLNRRLTKPRIARIGSCS